MDLTERDLNELSSAVGRYAYQMTKDRNLDPATHAPGGFAVLFSAIIIAYATDDEAVYEMLEGLEFPSDYTPPVLGQKSLTGKVEKIFTLDFATFIDQVVVVEDAMFVKFPPSFLNDERRAELVEVSERLHSSTSDLDFNRMLPFVLIPYKTPTLN